MTMDWYQVWLRIYAAFPAVFPALLVVDAPHGRFNSSNGSQKKEQRPPGLIRRLWTSPAMNVNGTLAWMAMELPSPILLLRTYSTIFPLATGHYGVHLLADLWLAHYLNRAIISPLRTPSRSPSHIIVPLAAIAFNTLNASLMGAYLASIEKAIGSTPITLPLTFWLGLGGAVVGLASNIWHDEILLRLRKDKPSQDNKSRKDGKEETKPRYSVPYGGLYKFVSYPNYLSEWFEWTCFAVAATSLAHTISTATGHPLEDLGLGSSGWYTPPWLFVIAGIAEMLPRAIRGHEWYKEKFGEEYPKERKAVFPFLL